MDNLQKKKNGNTVLFTFDSIVDIPIGVIMALRTDYKSLGLDASQLDISFLQQPKKVYIEARQELLSEDLFSKCFTEVGMRLKDTIYRTYTEEDQYKTVCERSPATNALRLVHGFANHSDGSIRITLLSHNDIETHILKGIFDRRCKGIIYKTESDWSKINTSDYGRIVVGDIRQLDEFKFLKARHITILNYGSNLQLVNGKPNILPDYVIRYGDINELEMLNAYDIKP